MRTLDLQRIRKDFNVTQKALADMLNINQSFLSNIENGRSPLPYDKRQKILEVSWIPPYPMVHDVSMQVYPSFHI